jgi:hypothetical protein
MAATAQNSLAEILLRLNAGLVSIIASFLDRDSKGGLDLDYKSLTDLSEVSRLQTIGVLRQLYQRLLSKQVPQTLPSARSSKEKAKPRKSGHHASPKHTKIRHPTLARVLIENSSVPSQIVLVRPSENNKKHQQRLYPTSQHHQLHRRPTSLQTLCHCKSNTRSSNLAVNALAPHYTSRAPNSSTNLQLRYPLHYGASSLLTPPIQHKQNHLPTSTTSVSAPRRSTPSLPPAREVPSSARFRCTNGRSHGTTRLLKRQTRKLWLVGGRFMLVKLRAMERTRRRKSDAGSDCLGGG